MWTWSLSVVVDSWKTLTEYWESSTNLVMSEYRIIRYGFVVLYGQILRCRYLEKTNTLKGSTVIYFSFGLSSNVI